MADIASLVEDRWVYAAVSWQQQIIAASDALTSPPIAPSVSEKASEPARSETRAPARAKT